MNNMLPFTAVAAAMAIPQDSNLDPGSKRFWVFWSRGGLSSAAILFLFGLLWLYKKNELGKELEKELEKKKLEEKGANCHVYDVDTQLLHKTPVNAPRSRLHPLFLSSKIS
jgi:hypothetical protein